jgi:hypothetical protein
MARDMAPGLLANLIVGIVEEFGPRQSVLAAWDLAVTAWGTRGFDSTTVRRALRSHGWRGETDKLYERLGKLAERLEPEWNRLKWETDLDPDEGYPVELPAWESSWVLPMAKARRRDPGARLWYEAAMQADEMITDRLAARRLR